YGNGGPDYRPDVVLGLEVSDMAATAQGLRAAGGRTISICSEYLYQGVNIHDFGPYSEVDLAIAGDGEATLPGLVEEIRRLGGRDFERARAARAEAIAAAHRAVREQEIEAARHGWNASPISVP